MTFTVPLIDDAHVEGPETMQLRLTSPLGATLGPPVVQGGVTRCRGSDVACHAGMAPGPSEVVKRQFGPPAVVERLSYTDLDRLRTFPDIQL